MRLLSAIVSAVLLAGFPSTVHADTITFEAFDDQAALGTLIPGLTFTNAIVLEAEISFNEEELPPHSGARVASDDFGPMRIDFLSPVSDIGGFFNYFAPVTLAAYDSANNLLDSVTSLYLSNSVLFGDVGSSPNEFLHVLASDISYITITGGEFGGSFTLDDLTFSQATAVPEPSSLSLVALGALGLGYVRRRARRSQSSSFRWGQAAGEIP